MALAKGRQTAPPALRWSTRPPFVLAQRTASKGDGGTTDVVSVLADPPRQNGGRSMRAVEDRSDHPAKKGEGEDRTESFEQKTRGTIAGPATNAARAPR